MNWLAIALFGGFAGLDTTSFPQVMISRPLVTGALTGVLFGRPAEGLALGFIVEAFALIVLPVGAARYPESGTATVAATSAYMAATTAGLAPGALALSVAFALGWEWVAGVTVVLHRRGNGRILLGPAGVPARQLERKHLAAMTTDFLRGAAITLGGALLGYGLLMALLPLWELGSELTLAVLAVLVATMIGTAVPLFGGLRARRIALAAGLCVGFLLAVVL
jgi:mannose/fructose/N-acetylgalactosamine-specific phosphotransferase system component IIC